MHLSPGWSALNLDDGDLWAQGIQSILSSPLFFLAEPVHCSIRRSARKRLLGPSSSKARAVLNRRCGFG